MILEVDKSNVKQGLLGLILFLVEVIRDALRTQALRRIESGELTDEECERLGRALRDLDAAIDSIKQEHGLEDAVRSLREGLDDVVNEVVQTCIPNYRLLHRDVAGRMEDE